MSEAKIDLKALFNNVKNNVLADSSERQSDEEVRRLYSRMSCIRFMRPLLNYASSFSLLHDRPYDQKFIDLLLFNTNMLESNGKNSFDPVNASLNLGYCVVKELAVATPDVSPSMLQGVFRASFPNFSNSIRSCLEAYNYQKAKPELLVAVFRDVYRSIVDEAKYSKIIDLIDGDFKVINDSKASLVCTELNALFKLAVAHDFPSSAYAQEGLTKASALDAVLMDTVNTVDLWVKQIADDSAKKGILATDAGVKLVQNLMNVTSDIMYDELVYQVRLSKEPKSKLELQNNKRNYVESARKGFVTRVGIYAEKTESIAYSFDNYVNMIGSVLYQQVYETSGSMRSALDIQLNPSSLPKLVKLISSSIDSSMLRLKDYLEDLKSNTKSGSDNYEYARSKHYSSSGDLTYDILNDITLAIDLSNKYISSLITNFALSDDLSQRHWFSSEIFNAIYASVQSFMRVTDDPRGLIQYYDEALDFVISDVEKFIRNHRIDWVCSNEGYNPALKTTIMTAILCSSVKAIAKNAKLNELTYVVKPYQLRDVILFSLNHTKNFFATNKNGMLSGVSNDGSIMIFQNLMSNISTFYSDAVYSAIVNVSKDPASNKADFMYNYHSSDVEIQPMLNSILEHAGKVHESVNLMRLTHLVSPVKKNEVASQNEAIAATENSKPQIQTGSSIKVRTLK